MSTTYTRPVSLRSIRRSSYAIRMNESSIRPPLCSLAKPLTAFYFVLEANIGGARSSPETATLRESPRALRERRGNANVPGIYSSPGLHLMVSLWDCLRIKLFNVSSWYSVNTVLEPNRDYPHIYRHNVVIMYADATTVQWNFIAIVFDVVHYSNTQ